MQRTLPAALRFSVATVDCCQGNQTGCLQLLRKPGHLVSGNVLDFRNQSVTTSYCTGSSVNALPHNKGFRVSRLNGINKIFRRNLSNIEYKISGIKGGPVTQDHIRYRVALACNQTLKTCECYSTKTPSNSQPSPEKTTDSESILSDDYNSYTAQCQQVVPKNEVAVLVNDVISKTSEQDKMVLSISQSDIEDSVLSILELGYSKEIVAYFFIKSPEYLKIQMRPVISLLVKFGFKPLSVLQVIEKNPSLCRCDEETFSDRIHTYTKVGFTHDEALSLVSRQPEILALSPKLVMSRISELRLLFKTQDSLKLILEAPELLTQDITVLREKFDYIFHVMGITQRQMMYSKFFNHSLDHIRARHMYLVRAGFFRKPTRKDGEINTNPLLQDILNMSNREFVKKFGNISVQDYETFCKLIHEEYKSVGKEDLDED